jgi:non-heme chloroperoxidase
MLKAVVSVLMLFATLTLQALAGAQATPPKQLFVEVEKDVKLEVLDWGGSGQPVILLAGLGFDAHNFDGFGQKLAAHYRVYGITRRGFGASSVPQPTGENYSAHRLADDVLAVIDTLKVVRPILVGHSIAGEELSSIGIRHPEKVAGLVYLDAGYPYAYYDPATSAEDTLLDSSLVRAEIDALYSLLTTPARKATLKLLVERDLPRFGQDLAAMQKQIASLPDDTPSPPDTPENRAAAAVSRGVEVHGRVQCPALAIFAIPHDFAYVQDAKERARLAAEDTIHTGGQADAFQKGNRQAHVVRIANASHFVFQSNEADVLREIDEFAAGLQRADTKDR